LANQKHYADLFKEPSEAVCFRCSKEVSNMSQRIMIRIVLALLLSLGLVSVASAHAELVSSDPAAGARLDKAPTKVTLVFSEEISEKETDSNFTVTDAQGNVVGTGKLDSTDLDHKTQSGTLKGGLGDGVYKVTWNAVTTDDNGHTTGSFTFGVNADPGAQPTAAPEPTEAPEPTAAAKPTAAAAAPHPTAVAGAANPTTLPKTGESAPNLSALFLLGAAILVVSGLALLRSRKRT
jgi:LPXTG-motif cell wall-anchored protein